MKMFSSIECDSLIKIKREKSEIPGLLEAAQEEQLPVEGQPAFHCLQLSEGDFFCSWPHDSVSALLNNNPKCEASVIIYWHVTVLEYFIVLHYPDTGKFKYLK